MMKKIPSIDDEVTKHNHQCPKVIQLFPYQCCIPFTIYQWIRVKTFRCSQLSHVCFGAWFLPTNNSLNLFLTLFKSITKVGDLYLLGWYIDNRTFMVIFHTDVHISIPFVVHSVIQYFLRPFRSFLLKGHLISIGLLCPASFYFSVFLIFNVYWFPNAYITHTWRIMFRTEWWIISLVSKQRGKSTPNGT